MKNRKYVLTEKSIVHEGFKLFRIKAVRDFGIVKAGDLGGFLEEEYNLSHDEDCWIFQNAKAFDRARIYGNARLCNSAVIKEDSTASNDCLIEDNVIIRDSAMVLGSAWIKEQAIIRQAWVSHYTRIGGNAIVKDIELPLGARIAGKAEILQPSHCLMISVLGSRDASTTFFRTKENGIDVVCGCFQGSIEEFTTAVEERHKGTKHYRTYNLAIELAKAQIVLD